MSQPQNPPGRMLQGTLNMLILQVLADRPGHGYEVMRRIRERSQEVFQLEEGSLYPALHRLEKDGLLKSQWKQSEANRRAKYYSLTARGKKQLVVEAENWNVVSAAISRILGTASPRTA